MPSLCASSAPNTFEFKLSCYDSPDHWSLQIPSTPPHPHQIQYQQRRAKALIISLSLPKNGLIHP